MFILCLSWVGPRGVTSVKIRVAIGVPARGAGGVEGRVRAGRVVRWWWVNEVFGFDWFEW